MKNILIVLLLIFLISCQPIDKNEIESDHSDNVIVSAEPLFNRDYFYVVDSVLVNAKKTIDVMMFSMMFYSDGNVRKLENDLTEAANRGIVVNVILENSLTDGDNDNDETYEFLKSNGVNVKMDPTGITTHSKIIIVDSLIVVVGSTNWSKSALNSNNEANVIIEDAQMALYFEDYFYNLWEDLK